MGEAVTDILSTTLPASNCLQLSGPDLCRESDLRHAMANCFEALIGKVFVFVCADSYALYRFVCHVD